MYRYLTALVECPVWHKVEKVPVTLAKLNDGSWFPPPVQGCDDACGAIACQQCCAQLTSIYFRHPDRPSHEVLVLELQRPAE